MSLCLAVVSGKGGTGKSTVSSGLAIAFSRMRKSVLLVDLDKGLKCLDTYFGVEKDVIFDLSDSIESGIYENAFYYPEQYGGKICIVPSPPQEKSIDKEKFADFVGFCKTKFDIIIFDHSAGLDFELTKDIDDINYICVTNSDPLSLKDASIVKQKLINKKTFLIINKFDVELVMNRTYKNIDSMIDCSTIRLIGIIPDMPDLKFFPVYGKIKKRGRTIKALNRIAGRLMGEDIALPRPKNI